MPLDRVPAAGGEFAWYHAVAVVRQLVDQLIPNPEQATAVSIPALNALSLYANGVLRVEAGPHAATEPVAALGALLRQLLANREQPPALRLLAIQAGATAPTISLADLVYQLGQWERPNRRGLLNAVYVMLSALPSPVVAMIAQAPISPAEVEIGTLRRIPLAGAQPRALTTAAVVGGVALVTVLFFIGAQRGFGDPPLLPSRGLPLVAVSVVPDVRAKARPAVAQRVSASRILESDGTYREAAAVSEVTKAAQPALPQRSVVSPRPAKGAPRTQRMVNAENEFRRAQELLGNHQSSDAVARFERVLTMIDDSAAGGPELRWMTNEFLTLGKALAEQEAIAAARVYTAADANIVQPVPLGQFLPAPPEGTDRPKVVQIVIDAGGRVETAKVIGARIGPRDYWWVAVAKAWRFQPAIKDGRPVKFLASIPIPDEPHLPR